MLRVLVIVVLASLVAAEAESEPHDGHGHHDHEDDGHRHEGVVTHCDHVHHDDHVHHGDHVHLGHEDHLHHEGPEGSELCHEDHEWGFPHDCFDDDVCLASVHDYLEETTGAVHNDRSRRAVGRKLLPRRRRIKKVCQRLSDNQETSGMRRAVRRKLARLPEEDRRRALERMEDMRAEKLECCSMATSAQGECFETLREQKYAKVCRGEEELFAGRRRRGVQAMKDMCCAMQGADDVEACFEREIRAGKAQRRGARQGRRQGRTQNRSCCSSGSSYVHPDGPTRERCESAAQAYTPVEGIEKVDKCKELFHKCCLKTSGLFKRRQWRRNRGESLQKEEPVDPALQVDPALPVDPVGPEVQE